MRILAIKLGYTVKSVLFLSFLFIMSLSLIGGCSDSDGEQNSTRALTEINFAEDSTLKADLQGVVVTFLESPMSEEPENDTGEVGIDLIPIRYARTTERTFCWEDDDPDAMHFMELQDSQGSVVLTVDVNGDCVTQVIEAGDYAMSIHHDGSIEDSLPIFLIPGQEESEQVRKPEVLIDRFKLATLNVLKRIGGIVTEDAQAQIFDPVNLIDFLFDQIQTRRTEIHTDRCDNCNLRHSNLSGADLRSTDLVGADLRHANLSGANFSFADLRVANMSGANMRLASFISASLRSANLRDGDLSDSNLTGADLTDADIRFANLNNANLSGAIFTDTNFGGTAWCDGSCICAQESIGTCNGCAPVEEVCAGPQN